MFPIIKRKDLQTFPTKNQKVYTFSFEGYMISVLIFQLYLYKVTEPEMINLWMNRRNIGYIMCWPLCLWADLMFQGWISKDILVDNSFVQGYVRRGPVGMRWWYLQTFTKDMIFDLLAIFFLPMAAVTFQG